jgi:hypothetical protein
MNVKSLLVAAVAAVSLSPVFAEEQIFDSSKFQSTKSRAEVIAELEIYRASGLQELERRDNVDFASPAYAKAKQTYAALRSNKPNFERRVMEIAQQRGEVTNTAAAGSSVRAQ